MQQQRNPIDVLWDRVQRNDEGCWPCIGSRTKFGHVHFSIGGRHYYAHRLAWEVTNGPIPEGMCILHRCDNPPCARPDHLFLGTRRDNTHDMFAKGRNRTTPRLGTDHHSHKITEADVHAIRAAIGVSRRALAGQYGVTPENISAIVLRKTWRHI